MHVLFYEFMLSLRRLWRRRVQTGLMLATFTVSIALSLISWSLFHTIFLQQPDFDPSGRLYRIGLAGAVAPGRIISATREDFLAWKEQQTVFTDFAPVMLYNSIFITTDNGVERLLSANVSAEILRMVGAKPLLGRLFTADEDKIGCGPVIMLSEKSWRNRFDADPNIIGRTLNVEGIAATVVGVMPASFRFPNDQEMWQPLGYSPFEKKPDTPVIDVVARLKPGITPGRAVEDLRLITERRGAETLAARFKLDPVITPFREYYLLDDMHRSALVLFSLALVFVLVSCANAANLAMIEFFGRKDEIASALALGVPRSAAIRGLAFQLLVTAGIAAVIGSALLLIVAPHVHSALERITTPYWLLYTPKWHHFAMAALLALLSAGVALVVPLGYLLVVSPEQIIREGAGSSRGSGRGWWRRLLMIGQIALLTVLAVSAGLLLRSSRHLNADHWGFDAQKIFASKTAMKEADFPTPALRLATHLRLMDEIERLPGVAGAAVMTDPLGFSAGPNIFYAHSADGLAEGRSEGGARRSQVTPDIFKVFDAPFLEGETFARDEKPDGPTYVVINHSLAQKLWPGQSALNRVLFVRGQNIKQPPIQVVVRGVVRDFQAAGPMADNNDLIYLNLKGGMAPLSFIYARGERAMPTAEDIRGAARRTDPRMAIYFPNSVQGVIDIQLSTVHLTTQLTSVYALAAVLLCGVGVYSITVSQILQRNREFGIRMALGIESRRLWLRFARGHLITAATGVLLGVVAAFAVVHVLQSLLFGVKERDPVTYALVVVIILLVSALACIPSLFRLQRINPSDCLRSL